MSGDVSLELLREAWSGVPLSYDRAADAMSAILDGSLASVRLAAFLAALRMRGETADEVAGMASVLRDRCVRVAPGSQCLLDTCGTGGDGSRSLNVSTAVGFVLAGAGVPVAKHGNRAISGHCGSADVLEALGVAIDLQPEQIARCVDEAGIGFMFAPRHHPAMAAVGPLRRELGVRTVFNILGPLANPALAERQVMGVFDPALCRVVAGALQRLGVREAMVVSGLDGMDEVSLTSPTLVVRVSGAEVAEDEVTPERLGLAACSHGDLTGGADAAESAAMLRSVLAGEPGPRLDIVLANASAALQVCGLADGWMQGVTAARRVIQDGRAIGALNRLTTLCGELRKT
jgi:anthranilate phosphoribosyltransferase